MKKVWRYEGKRYVIYDDMQGNYYLNGYRYHCSDILPQLESQDATEIKLAKYRAKEVVNKIEKKKGTTVKFKKPEKKNSWDNFSEHDSIAGFVKILLIIIAIPIVIFIYYYASLGILEILGLEWLIDVLFEVFDIPISEFILFFVFISFVLFVRYVFQNIFK